MQPRSPILFLALALAAGLVIGALTLGGQAILPGVLNQLANSGAVWIIIAFVIGRFAPSWKLASLAGLIALVGQVIGYYTTASIIVGVPDSFTLIYFWLAVALVAGPILGAAGFFSVNAHGRWQKIATGMLGAVFIGEGLYFLSILAYYANAALWLGLAVGITLAFTFARRERLQTLLVMVGLGLLFFAGELLLWWVDGLRAGAGL